MLRRGGERLEHEREGQKYEGTPYVPAEHIEGALITAAKEFKQGARASYMQFAKACFFVVQREISFNGNAHEWIIDERPVVINRARVLAWRPRWDKWELDFTLRCTQPLKIDDKTVEEILEHAGWFVGIGDFRPKYGRFEVVKCEAKDQPKDQKYRDYEVTLRGIVPLLHHKFTSKTGTKKKKVYNHAEEAIAGLYLKPD